MKNQFTFPSKDGRTNIHVTEWKPNTEIKGIVQIVHGMVEYIDRYDRFANFLNEHGFYVIGNDHLGHGRSVSHTDQLGYFAPNGNECLIEDLHTLQVMTQVRFPNLPYFILGHSMGSFLAHQYAQMYGDQFAGLLLLGTGYYSLPVLKSAQALCQSLAKTKGWTYRSKLLYQLTLGSANKDFEPARTDNDWISKDEKIVDDYNAHPWTSFEFTLNGYYTLFKTIEYVNMHDADIPKELPILLASGADDPIGNNGLGVKKVYDKFIKEKIQDCRFNLYEKDRHELLNETNYIQIQNDLLHWLEDHLEPAALD